MKYELVFSEQIRKQIKKLDNATYTLLKKYIEKHLLNTSNPKKQGKPLTKDKKGLWRYRIGSYRLIVQIKDKELIILALDFEHRSQIYYKK